jgi:toxin ParE1/3/4
VTYFLTPEAAAELADAASFCARQFSASVAENFLATFELKVRLIAEFPGVGTATLKGRRLFPIRRYPLFHSLPSRRNGAIRISAIAHHSRRPGYWQSRK